jgi:hypothetical protein
MCAFQWVARSGRGRLLHCSHGLTLKDVDPLVQLRPRKLPVQLFSSMSMSPWHSTVESHRKLLLLRIEMSTVEAVSPSQWIIGVSVVTGLEQL